MTIIKVIADVYGAHEIQTYFEYIEPMEGWAVVPEDMLPLENFPFGEAAVEIVDGVPTVTGWTPLPMPESDPELVPVPTTAEEQMRADIDYIAALTGVEL